MGHAIYNLRTCMSLFSTPANESMLEEPRAELTAMFALRMLFEQKVLDRAHLDMALAHFALDALRYFDKYASDLVAEGEKVAIGPALVLIMQHGSFIEATSYHVIQQFGCRILIIAICREFWNTGKIKYRLRCWRW